MIFLDKNKLKIKYISFGSMIIVERIPALKKFRKKEEIPILQIVVVG